MEIRLGMMKTFTLKQKEGGGGEGSDLELAFRLNPSLEETTELLEALSRGDKFQVVLQGFAQGLGRVKKLPLKEGK